MELHEHAIDVQVDAPETVDEDETRVLLRPAEIDVTDLAEDCPDERPLPREAHAGARAAARFAAAIAALLALGLATGWALRPLALRLEARGGATRAQ